MFISSSLIKQRIKAVSNDLRQFQEPHDNSHRDTYGIDPEEDHLYPNDRMHTEREYAEEDPQKTQDARELLHTFSDAFLDDPEDYARMIDGMDNREVWRAVDQYHPGGIDAFLQSEGHRSDLGPGTSYPPSDPEWSKEGPQSVFGKIAGPEVAGSPQVAPTGFNQLQTGSPQTQPGQVAPGIQMPQQGFNQLQTGAPQTQREEVYNPHNLESEIENFSAPVKTQLQMEQSKGLKPAELRQRGQELERGVQETESQGQSMKNVQVFGNFISSAIIEDKVNKLNGSGR